MNTRIGTGNPLEINAPLTTTEYFLRFEGNCDTSTAVSVTVEVLTGSVAPTIVNTDRNNICPGDGLITLGYTGGILGNGAQARWYADSGLTVFVGTGNNLSLSAPGHSTPYFVRFEGPCNQTEAVGVYLEVADLPIPPESAFSDRDSVCPGDGMITLSYSGGDPGTGGAAQWSSDPLFNNFVGTGNDLQLNAPFVSTTYYVRFENACATSSSVQASVEVYESTIPFFIERDVAGCSEGMLSRYIVSGLPGSSFTWNTTAGRIVSDYGDSILIDWEGSRGSFEVSVFETTAAGCPSDLVTTPVEVGGPDVDLGLEREGCEGTPVEILPEGTFMNMMWHDGSTGDSYLAETTGMVRIQVFDDEGCTARDSVQVAFHPQPVVDLGSDTTLCGESSITLDAGNPGAEYLWTTGETTRQIEVFAGENVYGVEVTYGGICTASDQIMIGACSIKDNLANIPNVFTPNGDGKNDTWFFYEAASYPDMVIEIFDRWGKLIYQSEPGYGTPWDGKSLNGKEMPMDSYHYIIRTGGEEITGTITIVR
jgi:gliding motility-associated-like protein